MRELGPEKMEQRNESKKDRITGTVIFVLVIAAFIGLLLCRFFGLLGSSGGT